MQNTELDIPEAAYLAATAEIERYGLVASSDAYDMASDALRAGAAVTVAAELRRFADQIGGSGAMVMHQRADELAARA